MLLIRTLILLIPFLLLGCSSTPQKASNPTSAIKPIEVKVVVVTMFEIGTDTDDTAGEFQLWRERQKLTQAFPFPQSHHDLFLNPETGVLGMVTGMGTNKSSSAIMALGLDPRFDLSKAYWLVAGISGFDPADASIGSAAWAKWAVDGDLGHEIDAREIPASWSTGYFPLFTAEPYDKNRPPNQGEVFKLNGALAQWAFDLTKNTPLYDDAKIAEIRDHVKNYPNAKKKPFVLMGDNLAGMTFWHGEKLNNWANEWVEYWTQGEGEFVSSAMEDTGTAQSLFYLDRAGKADYDRLMVLRTASNFTLPVDGKTPAENLAAEGEDYAGLNAALENAYRVGSQVVNHLVSQWENTKTNIPTGI